jgi:hypothetical protein
MKRLLAVAILFASQAFAAAPPDFTQGGQRGEDHDWIIAGDSEGHGKARAATNAPVLVELNDFITSR